jgi:cytosine/adenosine deaminase-related metal-dependent hydrolase
MTVDLLLRDAHVYVKHGWEIPGGWVAVKDRRVHSVGKAGEEPESARTISAGGRLLTPGLVNAHHHMYQNLTRAYAPVTNVTLFEWLTGLYPLWAKLDEESVYLSTYVAMTELLMGGCTTSMDHMYVHPKPFLIDAQFRAARDIGFRFYATRGSMTRSVEQGGLPPASVVQSEDEIFADSVRLVETYHDARPGSMSRVALAPCSLFSVTERIMVESARAWRRPMTCGCTRTLPRTVTKTPTAPKSTAVGRWSISSGSAGRPAAPGSPISSIRTMTRSGGLPPPALASSSAHAPT